MSRPYADMVRCVLIELTVFMGTLIVTSMVSATPVLVMEPNNTVVIEGETAVLMCSVANLREGFEVRWESHRDGTFAKNGTVFMEFLVDRVEPSRYRIVGDSTVGEFNLQIEGVDVTDDDQYMCAIFDTINVRSVSYSEKAQLTVDSNPTGYYPKCRPSKLKNYYLEGETLEAKCIFRKGNQTLELQWNKSGKSLKGHRPYNNSLADVTYQWPLSAANNGEKITCVANETLTCDVGPVEVHFKPRATMLSTLVKVIVGETAVFEVIGKWNPPPSSYSWSVNNIGGNNLPPRFSSNGSTLVILDTQFRDDNTSVSCVVSNSVGNARAHAKLRVLPAPMQTTSTKTTVTGVNQIGLLSTVSPLNGRPFSLLVIIILVTGASMFLIAIAVVIFYFASKHRDKKRNIRGSASHLQ